MLSGSVCKFVTAIYLSFSLFVQLTDRKTHRARYMWHVYE